MTLVGKVLAQSSSRPYLDWQFIVLDTDGVNAFASPGGIVHVTRGLLGLVKNESELAGVLGHEVTHVTAKHTVRAIEKSKVISLGTEQVGNSSSLGQAVLSQLASAAYKNIISNAFDRDDEMEADRVGIGLANKSGYSPHGLSDVLKRLQERNRDQDQPNGLFASHPLIKDRIANISSAIAEGKLAASATVAPRYAKHIAFTAKPLSEIPVIEGTRGLTGGESKPKETKDSTQKDTPQKDPKLGGRGPSRLGLDLVPGADEIAVPVPVVVAAERVVHHHDPLAALGEGLQVGAPGRAQRRRHVVQHQHVVAAAQVAAIGRFARRLVVPHEPGLLEQRVERRRIVVPAGDDQQPQRRIVRLAACGGRSRRNGQDSDHGREHLRAAHGGQYTDGAAGRPDLTPRRDYRPRKPLDGRGSWHRG